MAEDDSSRLLELTEAGAYWKYKVTLTAVKLDLFSVLTYGPMEAGEIAGRFHGNTDAFCVFLNALAALGLLRRESDLYSNSAFAETHLVRGRERYRGDQLAVDNTYWGLWDRLEEALLTGSSPMEGSLFQTDPESTERLVLGIHRDSVGIAQQMAELVTLNETGSLLDLGGGAGTYAIAFSRRYPELAVTVFDLPNTTRVTRSVLKDHGMEGRIQVIEGDFLVDPIGSDYDTVLMSDVLHGQGLQDNLALFRKVYGALSPGGAVIVRDVVMGKGLDSPQWGAVFAVNMLLHTGKGRCYSFNEIAERLAEAGFVEVREAAPNEVVTARKPG